MLYLDVFAVYLIGVLLFIRAKLRHFSFSYKLKTMFWIVLPIT